MSNERIWNDRAWAGTWLGSQERDVTLSPEAETEQCYTTHGRRLYRRLLQAYGSTRQEDIEDAVQQAFVMYLREVSSGRPVLEPFPWLQITAKNYLLNHIKYSSQWDSTDSNERLQRLTETLTDDVTVDDQLRRAQQTARFPAAIESLPPFEGRCFMARMENKKLRVIAAEEGVDLRRVAEALKRASDHVKRYINDEA